MDEPQTNEDRPVDQQFVPTVDPLDQGDKRSRRLVIGVLLAIAAISAVWIYIIFFYRPELLIDELADKTFPREAEQICARSQQQLEQLPFASQAASAEERADAVDRSNEILDSMIIDLTSIIPESPPVANEAVTEWIDDWTTYLGDRKDYATRLHSDPHARFLETAKGGPNKGITRAITSFAQVNRMESCATPADLS